MQNNSKLNDISKTSGEITDDSDDDDDAEEEEEQEDEDDEQQHNDEEASSRSSPEVGVQYGIDVRIPAEFIILSFFY